MAQNNQVPSSSGRVRGIDRLNALNPSGGSDQNTSFAGDLATSVGTGALQLPSVVTGLADIVASPVADRPFSRAADYVGDAIGVDFDGMAAERGKYLTPETQAAQAAVHDADGFAGTMRAMLANPRAIGTTIAESLPSTVAGGLLGAGVKAGAGALAVGRAKAAITAGRGAGASAPVLRTLQKGVVAGGVGEGAVSAGFAMSGIDEDVSPGRAALASLGAGAGVGILGVAGGKLAQKIGLTDPDLIFVGGRASLKDGAKRMGIAKRIFGGAASEGLLEEMPQSAVETMASNWAEGRPYSEGMGKAAVEGLIAGMGMGAAANIRGAKGVSKTKKDGEPGDPSRVEGTDFVGPPDPLKTMPARELIEKFIQIGYMLDREKSGINDKGAIASLEQARERGKREILERGYTQEVVDQAATSADYNALHNQLDVLTLQDKKKALGSDEALRAHNTAKETLTKKLQLLEDVYPTLAAERGQETYNDKWEALSRERDAETRAVNAKKGRKAHKHRAAAADLRKEMSELQAQYGVSYNGELTDDQLRPAVKLRGAPKAAKPATKTAAEPATKTAAEPVVDTAVAPDTTIDLSDEAVSDKDFLRQIDNLDTDEDVPVAPATPAADVTPEPTTQPVVEATAAEAVVPEAAPTPVEEPTTQPTVPMTPTAAKQLAKYGLTENDLEGVRASGKGGRYLVGDIDDVVEARLEPGQTAKDYLAAQAATPEAAGTPAQAAGATLEERAKANNVSPGKQAKAENAAAKEATTPAAQTPAASPEEALDAEIAERMGAAPPESANDSPTMVTFFGDNPGTTRTKARVTYLTKLEDTLDDANFDQVLKMVDELESAAVEGRQGVKALNKSTAQAEYARIYMETVRGGEYARFLADTKAVMGEPLTLDEMRGAEKVALASMSPQERKFFSRWLKLAMEDNVPNPYGQLLKELIQEGDRPKPKPGKPQRDHDIKNIQNTVTKALQKIAEAVVLERGLSSIVQARHVIGPYTKRASNLTGNDSIWAVKKRLAKALGKATSTVTDADGQEVTQFSDEARQLNEQLKLMKANKWLYTGEHFTNDADSSLLDRSMQENTAGPQGFDSDAKANALINDLRPVDNPSESGPHVSGAQSINAAEFAISMGILPGTVSKTDMALFLQMQEKLEQMAGKPGVAEQDRTVANMGTIAVATARLEQLQHTVDQKPAMLNAAREVDAYENADKVWDRVGKTLGEGAVDFELVDDNPAALDLWLMSIEQADADMVSGTEAIANDDSIDQADSKALNAELVSLKEGVAERLANSYLAAASAVGGASIEDRAVTARKKLDKLVDAYKHLIRRRNKLAATMTAKSDAGREGMEKRLGGVTYADGTLGSTLSDAQVTNTFNMGKSFGDTSAPTYADVAPVITPAGTGSGTLTMAQARKGGSMTQKLEAMREHNAQNTYWPKQVQDEGDAGRGEQTTVGKDDLVYTVRRNEDGSAWELWQTHSPAGYIEETTDTFSVVASVKAARAAVGKKLAYRTGSYEIITRKTKSQPPTKTADQVAAGIKKRKDNRPQSFEEGVKQIVVDAIDIAAAQGVDAALAAEAEGKKPTVKRTKAATVDPEVVTKKLENLRKYERGVFNWGRQMAGSQFAHGADLSRIDLYTSPETAAEFDDEVVTLLKMSEVEFWDRSAAIYAAANDVGFEDALAAVQRVTTPNLRSNANAAQSGQALDVPMLDQTNGVVEGAARATVLFAAQPQAQIYVAIVDTQDNTLALRLRLEGEGRAFRFPKDKITQPNSKLSSSEAASDGAARVADRAKQAAFWAEREADVIAKAEGKTVRESVAQNPVTNPSTVAQVREELKPFMPPGSKARIKIVQSFADLEMFLAKNDIDLSTGAGGFVHGDTVYMIADNINVGEAPGILMHEVGVHMGMTNAQVRTFALAIENLALRGDKLAQSAIGAAHNATSSKASEGASINQLDIDHETVAYFVQNAVNAGVSPTNLGKQSTGLATLFRNLMGFIRSALQAFGFRADALTAQHVVDAAYGAANTAMRTPASTTEVRESLAQWKSSVDRSYDKWLNEGQGRRNLNTLKAMVRKVTGMFMFSQDFADWVATEMPVARRYFNIVAKRQAVRGEMDAQLQRLVDPLNKLTPEERHAVNKYMALSQTEQAWGYTPHEGAQEPENISPTLKNIYDNVFTSQQREAVYSIFQYADKLQNLQQEAMRGEILNSNAFLLQNPNLSITDRAALEADLTTDLNEFDRQFSERRTAWLPLRRHGNYAIVYQSDKLLQAMQGGVSEADIKALRADENHYWVEFTNTSNKAQEIRDDLVGSKNEPGQVTFFEREEMMTKAELIPFNFMNSLKANIERNTTRDAAGNVVDAPTSAQLDAWHKLYITQLSETSIRKSELNRETIGGYDQDMIRGFVEYGSAVGGTIAGIKLNGETHDVLNEIRVAARDGGDNRLRLSEIKNEILVRHGQNINAAPNPLVEKTLGTTSFWMLLSSPAYYLQNSTQPWMLTLPVLGGRFGLRKSQQAMSAAYGVIGKSWSKAHEGATLTTFDGELANLEHIREEIGEEKYQLLVDLKEAGLFDVGVAADFGSFDGDNGQVMSLINNVHRKMIHGVRSVELLNRGVTALAAYDLAIKADPKTLPMRINDKGVNVRMTAREYAMETVLTTQGDYSGHNAPSIIRRLGGIGKVMTQFRKFQVIQIALLTRIVKASFKGADPAERKMARIQLGYMIGAHGAAGGLLGLPAANLAGMAITYAFGDDDDPDDFETMMRRGIGNSAVADVILKGLPTFANVDVSTKVGMGQTFALLPYTDMELSRDGIGLAAAALLGGPSMAQLGRMGDAAGMIADGNVMAGFTEALPRGLRDMGRAILYANRGVERKNAFRDVAIPASELSWYDIFSQGAGLPSQTLTKRQTANAGMTRSKEHFAERSTEIKAIYIEGRESKNPEKMREARKQWADLQDARAKVKFARQDFNLLTTSYRDKLKRQRSMKHGVLTENTNKDFTDVYFE